MISHTPLVVYCARGSIQTLTCRVEASKYLLHRDKKEFTANILKIKAFAASDRKSQLFAKSAGHWQCHQVVTLVFVTVDFWFPVIVTMDFCAIVMLGWRPGATTIDLCALARGRKRAKFRSAYFRPVNTFRPAVKNAAEQLCRRPMFS